MSLKNEVVGPVLEEGMESEEPKVLSPKFNSIFMQLYSNISLCNACAGFLNWDLILRSDVTAPRFVSACLWMLSEACRQVRRKLYAEKREFWWY